MPASLAEPHALQGFLRDFSRVDLRVTHGFQAPRAKVGKQLRKARSAILDDRAQRHDLAARISALNIQDIGLDSLVGGESESGDLVSSCGQGFDRALPANLRISHSKKTVRCEVVDRNRDYE